MIYKSVSVKKFARKKIEFVQTIDDFNIYAKLSLDSNISIDFIVL